jgi:GNAT superfamily N-acetyltransferase
MPSILPLDPSTDRALVMDLLVRSADYVILERGEPPSEAVVAEFFDDVMPGCDLSMMRKLGLFDSAGRIAGVIDMGFGFPGPGDAYLGLMQLAEDQRGTGLGRFALREVERIAREGGAVRLYLAVLEGNPRGRTFWEREGFTASKEVIARLGMKEHRATRMVKVL